MNWSIALFVLFPVGAFFVLAVFAGASKIAERERSQR